MPSPPGIWSAMEAGRIPSAAQTLGWCSCQYTHLSKEKRVSSKHVRGLVLESPWETEVTTLGRDSENRAGDGLSKSGQWQYNIQLSDICYFYPCCFFGLQSVTECLLLARSNVNDVTVHVVRDDCSAAQTVFFCLLITPQKRRFVYPRGF